MTAHGVGAAHGSRVAAVAPRGRDGHGREWRQFVLLQRDSLRRLLNAAMLSREGDPWQFALWITALLATPSFLFAFSHIAKYTALRRAPLAVIERVILVDRLFFVVYAMATAALLAALTWDALVPDRTDQEIVGVLPVRPRTLAAARLAGALALILLFSAAVHLPTAVIFGLMAAANPLVGSIPAVILGHALATTAAAVATFSALLVMRGLAAALLTNAAASTVAGVLQLASVAGLVETVIYLPSVLPYLAGRVLDGSPDVWRLPPTWFTAMNTVVSGPSRGAAVPAALIASAAVALPLLAALAVYLLPSPWVARRVLAAPSPKGTRYASAIVRLASVLLARGPAVRSMVAFTLGTFTRSRRHIFLLLTYIGFATAFAAISVISATVRRTLTLDMPAAYLMALPLVWMFFVAIGLRSAFAIPMEFEANWAFRLVGTQPTDAARAARAAMLALAVLPAAAVMGAVALALGWGVWVASTLAVLDVAWGAVLVQAVAFGWHAVPFARAHRPAVQSVKSRALVVVVPLYVFAFKGADAQFAVLHSARGAAIYVAVVMAACALLAAISRRESRRYGLTFDEDDSEAFTTLSLSDAL